jgi:hypothetical protein
MSRTPRSRIAATPSHDLPRRGREIAEKPARAHDGFVIMPHRHKIVDTPPA